MASILISRSRKRRRWRVFRRNWARKWDSSRNVRNNSSRLCGPGTWLCGFDEIGTCGDGVWRHCLSMTGLASVNNVIVLSVVSVEWLILNGLVFTVPCDEWPIRRDNCEWMIQRERTSKKNNSFFYVVNLKHILITIYPKTFQKLSMDITETSTTHKRM